MSPLFVVAAALTYYPAFSVLAAIKYLETATSLALDRQTEPST